MEVNNLEWEVKNHFFIQSHSSVKFRQKIVEEMKFESGKTLELPCTWCLRLWNQLETNEATPNCFPYEIHLELIDCPLERTSAFAGFVIASDTLSHWDSIELGRLEIEKREWVKGQPNAFMLNIPSIPITFLDLKICFKTFSTQSSIQNNQKAKEILLLLENKSKTAISEDNLKLLLEEKDNFSDFKIKMKDTRKEFAVHKNILAIRSPVLRTMFTSAMKEAADGEMEIDDLSTEAVEIILKFIYSGTMMSEEWTEVVQELMYAAHKYEITILLTFCDMMVGHVCSIENAISLLKLARKFKLMTAEKDIKRWILKNMKFEDILNNYALEELDEDS